jgi:hypothetical protein
MLEERHICFRYSVTVASVLSTATPATVSDSVLALSIPLWDPTSIAAYPSSRVFAVSCAGGST